MFRNVPKRSHIITYKVSSLFNCSIDALIKVLIQINEWTTVDCVPIHIKDILLRILSKRGVITDNRIKAMIHKKTDIVDFSECDISDKGLDHIVCCKNLINCNINSSNKVKTMITSASLQNVFKACKKLEIVSLRNCVAITDLALYSLAIYCPNLKCLDISGCSGLTDKSLNWLGRFSCKLESIDFSNTSVTDNGIMSLVGNNAMNFKEICMKKCIYLTDLAVETIVLNCLNILILVFDGCPLITEKSRRVLEVRMQQGFAMKQLSWTVY